MHATATEITDGYVDDVLTGRILAGRWIKAAARRYLDDRANGAARGLVWRGDRADHVIEFYGHCKHVKGRWAGSVIDLEPWQVFILANVFGWYRRDGMRRFRTVYEQVARKNAKSTKLAPVALYLLSADQEMGAEVYSAATTGAQARIVFDIAKAMVQRSKILSERLQAFAHSVFDPPTASKYLPINSKSESSEGYNVHGGLIDELHAHRDRKMFDVLKDGIGARAQPLVYCITTAGSNLDGICYEQRSYATKVLEGTVRDDTFFAAIYEMDPGDDWTDAALWIKSNPNLGVSVEVDEIDTACQQALALPSSQNDFKTKRLNLWVSAAEQWIDLDKYNACRDGGLTLDDEAFAGCPATIGLDLSSKVDVSAVSILILREGVYHSFGFYYLPRDVVEAGAAGSHASYAGWSTQGFFELTPGNVIDQNVIQATVLDLYERFNVVSVGYDNWQANKLAGELLDAGVDMQPVPRTAKAMSEPMKEWEAAVLEGRYRHAGNPVQTWMVSNVTAYTDLNGNIFPRKETKNSKQKIDGAVAEIMAWAQMQEYMITPAAAGPPRVWA